MLKVLVGQEPLMCCSQIVSPLWNRFKLAFVLAYNLYRFSIGNPLEIEIFPRFLAQYSQFFFAFQQ